MFAASCTVLLGRLRSYTDRDWSGTESTVAICGAYVGSAEESLAESFGVSSLACDQVEGEGECPAERGGGPEALP